MSCCPSATGHLKARLKRRDPCAHTFAEVDRHAQHRSKPAGVGEPEHARYLAGVRGLHELEEIGQVSEAQGLGYGPNRHVLVWVLQQVMPEIKSSSSAPDLTASRQVVVHASNFVCLPRV